MIKFPLWTEQNGTKNTFYLTKLLNFQMAGPLCVFIKKKLYWQTMIRIYSKTNRNKRINQINLKMIKKKLRVKQQQIPSWTQRISSFPIDVAFIRCNNVIDKREGKF